MIISRKLNVPSVPKILDAKYIQIFALLAYSLTAREVFHFERPYSTLIICLLTALFLDSLIGWYKYSSVKSPITPIIIALGASILVDARGSQFFALVVALAIFSKGFITYKGRHFFNPTNFGVVLLLTFFPHSVTGIGGLFSEMGITTFVFFALGTFTVWQGNQIAVSYSWLIGHGFFGIIRSYILDQPILYSLGTLTNPIILLFTFHMISDPATTPSTRKGKVAFGLSVAALDAIFRFLEVPHGHFYALFAIGCLMPVIRDLE